MTQAPQSGGGRTTAYVNKHTDQLGRLADKATDQARNVAQQVEDPGGCRQHQGCCHPRGGRGRHCNGRRRHAAEGRQSITVKGDNEDQDARINIVRKALQSPSARSRRMRGVEGSIVVGKVMDERSAAFGYDAQANEYCDMFEKGIIDLAKIVRIALQDGASIASLMITTEAGVAEASKKEAGQPDHNHRGMGRHDVMARIELL